MEDREVENGLEISNMFESETLPVGAGVEILACLLGFDECLLAARVKTLLSISDHV